MQKKNIMSTSIINHLAWFQDRNLAAAKSTLISRNQVYLQCILPPRVHLQWLIHSQGAVMHMPVNKANVNCTYDSSHGTDEIYPKGPPHIYIYTIYIYIICIHIYNTLLYYILGKPHEGFIVKFRDVLFGQRCDFFIASWGDRQVWA